MGREEYNTYKEEKGFSLAYRPNFIFIDTEEEAKKAVDYLSGFSILAVDTETTGLNPYKSKLLLLQIATPDVCYILNCTKVDPKIWAPILENKNILKILHNAKFDYKFIKLFCGVSMRPVFDTMIAEALITAGLNQPLKLDFVVMKYLGLEIDKGVRSSFIGQYKTDFSIVEKLYAANDALILHQVYNLQLDVLERDGLVSVALLEFNTIIPIAEIELSGCMIDVEKWRVLVEIAKKHMWESENKVRKILEPVCSQKSLFGGCSLNIASPKQLLDKLLRLGITVPGRRGERIPVPDTAEETLEYINHPIGPALLEYRGWEKLCTSYGDKFLEKINKESDRLYSELNQMGAGTGRTSCKKPNLQQIPGFKENDESTLNFRSCFIPKPGYKLVTADYCLAPETRVLTSDLRWVPLSGINVGDELIGLDEDPGPKLDKIGRKQPRVLRRSTVEKRTVLNRQCYKITFSNGTEIVSSDLHKWLLKIGNGFVWRETRDVKVGSKIAFFIEPWECMSNSWESGYLVGMFDGEGTISGRQDGVKEGCSIAINQRPNSCIRAVLEYMSKFGFDMKGPFVKKGGFSGSHYDVGQYWISSMPKMLKFLGVIRPFRLLEKSCGIWETKVPNLKSDIVVSNIEFVGDKQVIGIQTSTRTFIAEGFVSHNSQQEIRVLAEISGDERFIEAYHRGLDRHTQTAIDIWGGTAEEVVANGRRKMAKEVSFLINYGGQAFTLAKRVGITEEAAQDIMDSYFRTYPKVKIYMDKAGKEALDKGYSVSLSGRRRYYSMPKLDDEKYENKVNAIKRKGANMPIQASSADIGKQAICYFFYELEKSGLDAQMTMFIHDEFVCEAKEEHAPQVAALLEKCMVKAFKDFCKKVPIEVSACIDDTWHH